MINLIKSNGIQGSLVSLVTFSGLASLSFAQSSNDSLNAISGTVNSLGNIVNSLTGIAVALAFLFFFYNLAIYILKDGADAKTEAIHRMGWATLAIFFIVSIWGIIGFIGKLVGVENPSDGGSSVINLPTIRTTN